MTLRTLLLASVDVFGWVQVAPAQAPAPLKVQSVEFTATPAPANALEMTQPYTRSEAVVRLADGSRKRFPLSYQVLHRSGDFVGGWYAGLIVDKAGRPVVQSARATTSSLPATKRTSPAAWSMRAA